MIKLPDLPLNKPRRSVEGWSWYVQWFVPTGLSQEVRELVARMVIMTLYPPERDWMTFLLQALDDVVSL